MKLSLVLSNNFLIKISSIALATLFSIIIARFFTPEIVGIFNLSMSYLNIISLITLIGTSEIILSSNNKDTFNQNSKIISFNSIIYSTVSFVTLLIIYFFIKNKFIISIAFLSITILPYNLIQYNSNYMKINGYLFKSIFINDPLINLFRIVILFLTYIVFEISFESILFIYISSIILTFCYSYWINKNDLSLNIKKKEILKFYKKTYKFTLNNGIIIISNSLDIILLSALSSIYDVGIYSIIIKITLIYNVTLNIINSTFTYQFKNNINNKVEIEKITKKTSLLLVSFGCILYIITLFFGDLILSIWGDEYKSGYYPLIILSFGYLINLISGPVSLILILKNEQNYLLRTSIINLIINLIGNIFLINFFGLIGACISTTISMCYLNLHRAHILYKKFNIKTMNLF
ncbi:oligosaccharide flippase family protein [Flammeovirga kamogawensis]|uniref:Polysaccharide biosynthesis C-terminal domain-containing protein n=1 Tax=Flammeovirga kamogawensis TaxID=373891 RepID=A0ABX8GYQ5_9BACT|nr:polysaccharide biosynthesis C-terminal domain-containing protein [Flammeovirga kamogawensis]MBB6458896.1 O-antigen/teichoic acid export membrane protein [Flammeovirga kamogawensis]QWG08477.1 polysaccharide biosynthesis C-terminal domain-containing protein [Flammeovirga kamogawensis]TRX66772.1 oligosaccharide flippase family protein [Flammeovirga kamogawensis]